MKFKQILPAAAAALLSAACTPSERAIDYPFIETANTTTLDIAKVELSDTATILRTDAYFTPHYWIKISSESYLLADGKKYALKSTQGIEADSLFWMPESGEASFTLTFEPLPKNTRSFDFIESDCPDCFKLFGISTDPKKAASITYPVPEEVPQALRHTDPDASVPAPIFKSGESTVNIHLMGYRKEMGNELNLYVNNLFGKQEPYTIPVDEKSGTATAKFMQYGTAQAIAVFNTSNGHVWLAPGETAELYIDLKMSGRHILARRAEKRQTPRPEPIRTIYASGSYGNLTSALSVTGKHPHISMNLYSGKFADYRMKADQYAQHVTETYRLLSDSIANSAFSPIEKEMMQLGLKQEALAAIAAGDRIREHNYRSQNKAWDHKQKVTGIDKTGIEQIASVCKLFDINDPKLLMGNNLADYVRAAAYSGIDWSKILPEEKGLVFDLRNVMHFAQKAENMELDEQDIQYLKTMDNPFYLEAFETMQNDAKAKLAAVDGKAQIEPTPDVPNDKLLETIIAPYKGKVVLIDFWNTWCGPCRMSIKANEPLKDNELKSDRLVWLYIANETSPMLKYKTMIPDIKGKHYRLNNEQWAYLCDKLKIDGIPSYVLVDKSGKYQLRNDLRDHNNMKNTLKSLIQ